MVFTLYPLQLSVLWFRGKRQLANIYSFEFLPKERSGKPVSAVEVYARYSINTQK